MIDVSAEPNMPEEACPIEEAPGPLPFKLVEEPAFAVKIQEARVLLQGYRYSQLASDGTETWRRARQNNSVMIADNLELIDLTRWDKNWVKNTVVRICQDLKLTYQVRFLFQESWTILDRETGIEISNGEKPETSWESYVIPSPNGNIVRICLAPALKFPLVWDNKRALFGQALRRVTWFSAAEEMFLYLAARELRFLWQWENQERRA
jgi:hypothetical protein